MAARSEDKKAIQARQQAWIRALSEATGLPPTPLGTRAGVAESTLTRLMNDPDYAGILGPLTIERITQTYGVPGPDQWAASGRALGLDDAEPIEPARESRELRRVIEGLLGRDFTPWRITTDVLAGRGYLAGDVVAVDERAEPQPHDAVLAEMSQGPGVRPRMLFRIFLPPHLVALSSRVIAPELLGDRVRVRGVVMALARIGRLGAA